MNYDCRQFSPSHPTLRAMLDSTRVAAHDLIGRYTVKVLSAALSCVGGLVGPVYMYGEPTPLDLSTDRSRYRRLIHRRLCHRGLVHERLCHEMIRIKAIIPQAVNCLLVEYPKTLPCQVARVRVPTARSWQNGAKKLSSPEVLEAGRDICKCSNTFATDTFLDRRHINATGSTIPEPSSASDTPNIKAQWVGSGEPRLQTNTRKMQSLSRRNLRCNHHHHNHHDKPPRPPPQIQIQKCANSSKN